MNYLKKLTLHNVKSHSHSVLEFSENTNSITGDNNEGKTSVCGALSAIFYGTPIVVKATTDTQTEAYIVAEFTDGTVSRFVSVVGTRNEHRWELTIDGVTKTFNHHAMPEEIVEFLNMAPVELNNEMSISLNISSQFPVHGMFMINGKYTGGIRARMLGSVSNQRFFDEINTRLRALKREKTSEKKAILKLLDEAKARVERVKELEDTRPAYKEALVLERDLKILVSRSANLHGLVEEVEGLESNISSTIKKIGAIPAPATLERLLDELVLIDKRIRVYSVMIDRTSDTARSLAVATNRLKELGDIPRIIELTRELSTNRYQFLDSLMTSTVDALKRVKASELLVEEKSPDELLKLVEDLEDLGKHVLGWERLLHSYTSQEKLIEDTNTQIEVTATKVNTARLELQAFARTLKTCPYAPFEVALQKACQEAISV